MMELKQARLGPPRKGHIKLPRVDIKVLVLETDSEWVRPKSVTQYGALHSELGLRRSCSRIEGPSRSPLYATSCVGYDSQLDVAGSRNKKARRVCN